MNGKLQPLGTPLSPSATRVMLLGSGELGKEVAIAAQRLGRWLMPSSRTRLSLMMMVMAITQSSARPEAMNWRTWLAVCGNSSSWLLVAASADRSNTCSAVMATRVAPSSGCHSLPIRQAWA